MDDVKLVKKKKKKIKISFSKIFIIIMCLLMIVLAITKIVLLKGCLASYLLVVLAIINLPWLHHKIFKKTWLTWINFIVVFISLMGTIMHTNYYGKWYNEDKYIEIDKENIYLNEEKFLYEEVLLNDVKRLIVKLDEQELVFHYWRDKNNNEIYFCEFSNNQCKDFYEPKIKNIFYRYVGD